MQRGQERRAPSSRRSTPSPTGSSSGRSGPSSAGGSSSSSPAARRSPATWPSSSTPRGILILEGYGLTESSAASFCNRPTRPRIGTVGPPFPGTEVRIAAGRRDPAARPLHHARLPQPARGDRARRSTPSGWLHTGDIGAAGRRGLPSHHRPQEGPHQDLRRQVRRAAGARGAAQGPLPLLSQVLVHGDKRNYVTALVTLDVEATRTLVGAARGSPACRTPSSRSGPRRGPRSRRPSTSSTPPCRASPP